MELLLLLVSPHRNFRCWWLVLVMVLVQLAWWEGLTPTGLVSPPLSWELSWCGWLGPLWEPESKHTEAGREGGRGKMGDVRLVNQLG